MTLSITTPEWRPHEAIPRKFTADGADRSPRIDIQGVPPSVRSLALICDDPDAPMGTWVHWVLFNLPPTTSSLPEGIGPSATLPDGSVHGRNSWSRLGYGGPSPPPGKPHRYFFKVYALDIRLALAAGATAGEVEGSCEGHVLASAQMMGTYGRP